MPKGNYTCDVHCPDCAAKIPVKVSWEQDYGTRLDPPYFETFLTNPDGSDVTVCESCGHLFADGEYEQLVEEAEKLQPPDEDDSLFHDDLYEAGLAHQQELADEYTAEIEREFERNRDHEAETRHLGPEDYRQ